MPGASEKTFKPEWSFCETDDDKKNTEATSINTGIDMLLTYECGHVIPLPTQEDPHPSKTECRQCAWRKAFYEVRDVRKANQRQGEELRKAMEMNHTLWEGLHWDIEHDDKFDGTAIAARERLADFLDVTPVEWHRKIFAYEMLMANSVRDVMDAWVKKWGQPTKKELNRWVHWKLQAADEAEAEREKSLF